ncbi:hypothetical protein DSM104443_02798 [Usitatibacter rugosus]|uniref:Lipopolysaccharide transport system ATP-binding protein n=1 Tax=Usitatibacter rugosus TaxID=2732067 RepID=A0A6M4GWU6_9PROT|nr:hypothetical protein DSM104443_02798 [Usitatibacter rugosus]
MLEVGTGFHPELTGRENIYLNGAILGMARSEIKRKFDEIVDFAEVERFLDTPVKRYSSGMYVRLAFSVAAHLDPEILIVDEVLAVGDAEFQRKCLGKMKAVAKSEQRTVLFVSHNMAAIETLCTRAIFLRHGKVAGIGPVGDQIQAYLGEMSRREGAQNFASYRVSPTLTLTELTFTPNPIESGTTLRFAMSFSSLESARLTELSILVYSALGTRVAIVDLRSTRIDYRITPDTPTRIQGAIDTLPLVEGEYSIGLYMSCGSFRGDIYDLTSLSIVRTANSTEFPPYAPHDRGLVELSYEFDIG